MDAASWPPMARESARDFHTLLKFHWGRRDNRVTTVTKSKPAARGRLFFHVAQEVFDFQIVLGQMIFHKRSFAIVQL